MRLLYLGNNWLGWKVLEWLRAGGADEIAALVIHPAHKQKFTEQMLGVAALSPDHVFDGSRLREPDVAARIRELGCDAALSVLFDYVLEPSFLDIFPKGVLNLHPSYLPYNRGQCPNVWSIVEGTPAGVTLHYIDEGIDTGDIIAQRRIAIEPVDTGESLYHKLERAALDLFRATWPAVRAGQAGRRPQNGTGSAHRTCDTEYIDRIDLDRTYRGRELLDILRARTFPPYRGAYFEAGGKRVYMRLALEQDEDV